MLQIKNPKGDANEPPKVFTFDQVRVRPAAWLSLPQQANSRRHAMQP
jgi:hypothetical protein